MIWILYILLALLVFADQANLLPKRELPAAQRHSYVHAPQLHYVQYWLRVLSLGCNAERVVRGWLPEDMTFWVQRMITSSLLAPRIAPLY